MKKIITIFLAFFLMAPGVAYGTDLTRLRNIKQKWKNPQTWVGLFIFTGMSYAGYKICRGMYRSYTKRQLEKTKQRMLKQQQIKETLARHNLTINQCNKIQKQMIEAAFQAQHSKLKVLIIKGGWETKLIDKKTFATILASLYYKKEASESDLTQFVTELQKMSNWEKADTAISFGNLALSLVELFA